MSIGALIRRDTRVPILHHFPLHHHVKTQKEGGCHKPGERSPPESDWQASDADFQPRIISNKFSAV